MERDAALTLWTTLREEVITDPASLRRAIDALALHARDALQVSGAGVLVASDGQQRAVLGASDDRMRQVEQFQTTYDEGPCMEAYGTGRFAGATELAGFDADRWPLFGSAAVAAGIMAAFSFPLMVGDLALGALDCYRRQKGPLTPAQIRNGEMFADIATDLIMHAQIGDGVDALVEQMVRSNGANDRIEQARGITAHHLGVSVGGALELMRDDARRHQRGLDEVAGMIVDGRLRLQ
ncbi:GAF and ANTAR domain-containing protein [soil metagenome]